MSARARLPHRRPSVVTTVAWTGKDWPVCFGFDADGHIREIFLKGGKTGSEIEGLVDDACVVLSLLLQHGLGIDALADHLGREGVDPASPAASLIGLAARLGAEIEAEEGAAMAASAALYARCPRWVPGSIGGPS